MKPLQIDENKAREIYPSADQSLKIILEGTFGKDFFSQKITDRVKTFDDILSISGLTIESLVSHDDTPDEVAYKKAKLIARVYNEGTILDPNNTKQYKYFPWFRITPGSGFGLSYVGYAYWATHTRVGVRLCFKESNLAIDAGKKFPYIYAELLIK